MDWQEKKGCDTAKGAGSRVMDGPGPATNVRTFGITLALYMKMKDQPVRGGRAGWYLS